jgi:DNA mismatch repair ATPase MutS
MTHELSHAQAREEAAAFRSILFDKFEIDGSMGGQEPPEFFTDLNLDQIVASMTEGREEYNLKPFFYTPVHHVETVNYRQDILRDLESRMLMGHIRTFAQRMRTMRDSLAQSEKLHYKYQKHRWFLYAAEVYCAAVSRLTRDLTTTELFSRGFLAFREYLTRYTESADFTSLVAETEKLRADLLGIRYGLRIKGNRIEVQPYATEADYGAEVLRTFEKFKEGAPKDYRFEFYSAPEMNHIEAVILDMVAHLFPEIFSSLDEYCDRHSGYLDSTVKVFDREVQFYVACLEHVDRYKAAGLSFCYPVVTAWCKEVYGHEVFDLALANNLVGEKKLVVTNDFYLRDPERIFVVSGPNQGGKTTFARTFGQLHYLASIGCPVQGCKARLFLFDQLFTHFEREEQILNLSGKLEDDLQRIHRILERATPQSILIMNESFVSTTLNDALFLSKQIMQQIVQLDMLCVSVTFLDELASLSETTVSMASTVDPEAPELRTFKVIRKPADGLAYAAAIAKKYQLTYESVRERIAP